MSSAEDRGHSRRLHVLFVAAESDALPGAKVGGIGDVMRDLPPAIADSGVDVTVVLPSYGVLHKAAQATHVASLPVRFGHGQMLVDAYRLSGVYGASPGAPQTYILHSEHFSPCGVGRVYCDDPADAPFATDATKYALFGAAVLEAASAGHFGTFDVFHLHDWHAAFVSVLVAMDPRYRAFFDRRRVYSIHNLALQGVRPFDGHVSSFSSWFPWLPNRPAILADPRWTDCVNPMAAGIRLAHRVHTVSPTYAREVVQSNDPNRGFHGGEGLEQDLARIADEGRLLGILNGVEYTESSDKDLRARDTASRSHRDAFWQQWMTTVASTLERAIGASEQVRSVDWLAHQRALKWSQEARPRHVLTSVGRLVQQKASILAADVEPACTALEKLLRQHEDAVLILVGTGDKALETVCRQVASRCPNLLFINRYSAELAAIAYSSGDLFLMPSSFEPCGISQMMAMTHGQPCLVHAVGGLVDTVQDGTDGFHFSGTSLESQAQAMLHQLDAALKMKHSDAKRWQTICNTAASRRFDWSTAATRYRQELYDSL